jgi:4-carboxymuconolactone decarboxylase
MSLVSLVPDEIYTKALGSPQTANLLRVAFNAPAWAEAFVKLAAVEMSGLSLKPEHRELVFLRTASYLGGRYAWAGHENLARKSGVSDEQIEAIRTGEDGSAIFSEEEQALLKLVVLLCRRSTERSVVWQAQCFFTDQEIVEIIAVHSLCYSVTSLTSALHVELDQPSDETSAKVPSFADSAARIAAAAFPRH